MSQNILNQVQQFRFEIRQQKLQNIFYKKRVQVFHDTQYDNDTIQAELITELQQEYLNFQKILNLLQKVNNFQELSDDMIQIFYNLIQKKDLQIKLEVLKIITNFTYQNQNVNECIIFIINEIYQNNEDQNILNQCILVFGNLCYESQKVCDQLQNIFMHFIQKINKIESIETYNLLIWFFVCASKWKLTKNVKNGFISIFLKAILQQDDLTILNHSFQGLTYFIKGSQCVQNLIDFEICFKIFQYLEMSSCQNLVLQMVKYANSNQIQNFIEEFLLDQLVKQLNNDKILEIMTYMFAQDINYADKLFKHPIWNLYIDQLNSEFQNKRLVIEGLYFLAFNGDEQTIFQIINQNIHNHFFILFDYQDIKMNDQLNQLIQLFIQTDQNYKTKLELINFQYE